MAENKHKHNAKEVVRMSRGMWEVCRCGATRWVHVTGRRDEWHTCDLCIIQLGEVSKHV